MASMDDLQNLVEIGLVVPEILMILRKQDGGCAAILDLVQRLKLTGNLSMASMRRSAKFSKSWCSGAGEINDFRKSKMAAVPPSWI